MNTDTLEWRTKHDWVRKVPGEELWLVRDYPTLEDVTTAAPPEDRPLGRFAVHDRSGNSLALLFRRGDRVHVWSDDHGEIGSARLLKDAAVIARDVVYARWAETAADDDPSEVMHEWDAARPRSGKTSRARAEGLFGVGPSDLGACEKAVEFRERPPEGHVPLDIPKDAAILGTLIHDALTDARRWRYPWRQFGVPIEIVGLDAPGEIDEYDPYIGRVIDYKTASKWKWESIGDEGPPLSEWEQVMGYAKGMRDQGHKVETVQLLYYNRNSGQPEVFTRDYNEHFALQALARLHVMMDALEDGHPLPRRRQGVEMLGPTVDTFCAELCPHVVTCWNLTEVPEHRTPGGWLLVKDDDDGAIEATLEKYDLYRKTESAGRKEKAKARDHLEGLEPGRYGDMLLGFSRASVVSKPDPEARVKQLEEAIQLAIDTGTPPPSPEELLYPETPSVTEPRISVHRVRAAQREKEAKAS